MKAICRFAAMIAIAAAPAFAQAPKSTADLEASVFKETVKHLDMDGNSLLFLNATDVISVMDKAWSGFNKSVFPLLLEGNPNRKQFIVAGQKMLDSLYKTSGLREIQGMGVSNRHMGDGIYRTKAFLQLDPGKKGRLWSLLGKQPKSLDYLGMLPKTTVGASFTDLDLGDLWKWHFDLVKATDDPQVIAIHGMVMGQLKQRIDFESLLASTSGTFGIVVTLDSDNMITMPGRRKQAFTFPEPGFALVAKVKDTTLKDFLLSKMTRRQDGKRVPIPFTDKTVNGIQIRSFTFGKERTIPFSPSFATIGDYLVVTNTLTMMEAMAAAKVTGNGLASQPKFKELMADMPKDGNGFAYANPLLTQTFMDVQKQMVANSPKNVKRAMEAVMKAYQRKADTFGVTITRVESNGLAVIGKANVSAPRAVAEEVVMMASWGLGMVLPRMTKGANQAKQVACQNNLKQIGLGLLMYAGDHKGAFPDDLGFLFEGDYLKEGRIYVCPGTDDTIPRSAADIRAGKCSYVYLGKGLRDDAPNGAKLVVAYEKPSNHGSSVNFLFVDGHVESVETKDPVTDAKARGWTVPEKK